MSEPTTRFDSAARASLAELADVLIPAEEGMPSASQAGATGAWLNATLEARPDLGPPLAELVERWRGIDPTVAVSEIAAEDPAGYEVLTTAITGAYFLNPEVRDRIGYPGQRAVPMPTEGPPDYDEDGLLASVIARGPIFRPTPEPAADPSRR